MTIEAEIISDLYNIQRVTTEEVTDQLVTRFGDKFAEVILEGNVLAAIHNLYHSGCPADRIREVVAMGLGVLAPADKATH